MYMQSVDWKKFRAWLENSPWDLMLFIAGSMCYIKLHCLCSRKPGFTYVGCVCSKEKGSGNRPCLMAGQVWVTHSHPCHSQLLLRQDFMNRHCCSVAKHHELQHARLPCPSLSPGVCSNSCPLSQWCYLTILSSVALFSFCLESFPASGSFPMNRLFESDAQSIGVSTSASVLPMDIQGWFPLGLTGLISLQSKGLASIFSNTTVQKHQFLALSLLYGTTLTSILDHWKNHNFDYTDLYRQSDVSLIHELAPILMWY